MLYERCPCFGCVRELNHVEGHLRPPVQGTQAPQNCCCTSDLKRRGQSALTRTALRTGADICAETCADNFCFAFETDRQAGYRRMEDVRLAERSRLAKAGRTRHRGSRLGLRTGCAVVFFFPPQQARSYFDNNSSYYQNNKGDAQEPPKLATLINRSPVFPPA